jgi:hypothetical protein
MSNPNVLAASAAARIRPPTPILSGFDVVAERLVEHMHLAFETQGTTSKDVVNTAYKSLSSSFIASIKGVRAPTLSDDFTTVTPSTNASTRTRRSSSISSVSNPTPILFPRLDDPGTDENVPNNIDQPHRLDRQWNRASCNSLPMRRLRMKDIVRLRVSDEFVLFIPPENKKSPLELKEAREYLLNRFKKS